MNRLVPIALFVAGMLLLTTAPSSVSATPSIPEGKSHITVSYEPKVTDDGSVTANLRVQEEYELPPGTDEFRIQLPPKSHGAITVKQTTGFRQLDQDEYKWDEKTERPAIEFVVDLNAIPENLQESYGTEDWAFTKTSFLAPGIHLKRNGNRLPLYPNINISGQGAYSTSYVFFGEHQNHTFNLDGQEMHVVVPEAANPREDISTVSDVLRDASKTLPNGGAPIYVIVAPDPIRMGGEASGPGFFVGARSSLSTWVHEYVHTTQHFYYRSGSNGVEGSTRWITEGGADYYAMASLQEHGHRGYDAYYNHVSKSSFENEVLADRLDEGNEPYIKGRRVLAYIDVQIRDATNNSKSLIDVYEQLNSNGGVVTNDEFFKTVDRVAGTDISAETRKYVETSAAPTVPFRPDLYTDYEPVKPGTDPRKVDSDSDGLSNWKEYTIGTDHRKQDTDGDGLADGTEVKVPKSDPLKEDTDGDGLSDNLELEFGSNPQKPNSDNDELSDLEEYEFGSNPTKSDADGDALEDHEEREQMSDPYKADTDDDGLNDWKEFKFGSDPRKSDADGDGLSDQMEFARDTNPNSADTDGDGFTDKEEVGSFTNPKKPSIRVIPEIVSLVRGVIDWASGLY